MPLNEYINQLLDYQVQLAHTSDKLDDRAVLTHLLETLPEVYGTTIETINNQPEQLKSKDYVFSTLRAAERRLQRKNLMACHHGVFSMQVEPARGSSYFSNRPLQSRPFKATRRTFRSHHPQQKVVTCYYCLKPGHRQSSCRLKLQAD